MASDLYKSVDTIANLLYLIKLSLDDTETASIYLGFAEDEIKAIRLRARPSSLLPLLVEKDCLTTTSCSSVVSDTAGA
jgi:hypothetical protein